MLREKDWSRLYYALIRVYDRNGSNTTTVLGIGETVLDAKVNAANHFMTTKGYSFEHSEAAVNQMMKAELDYRTYITTGTSMGNTYYLITYIEAKAYEYAKVCDIERLDVMLDPTVKENVLRYMGLKKGHTSKIERNMEREERYRYIE